MHNCTTGLRSLLLVFSLACASATQVVAGSSTFDVEVGNEVFTVRVATDAQASDLRARLRSGTRGVISGTLGGGDGGFNAPFKWHLVPQSVQAPDFAIELCDGKPSMVDTDLAYWMGSVKQYCPWAAKVVRER